MRKKPAGDARESQLAQGWIVESDPVAEPAAQVPEAVQPGADPLEGNRDGETTDAQPQLSNAALVLLGVIGGLYLLYSWVWLSWAQHYSQINALVAEGSGAIGGVLQQIVFWVAPLAPALWFLSAYLLNRGRPTWRLALWLVIGAVVLVPLPALIVGGAS